MSALMDAALRVAARGLPVLACQPGSKRPLTIHGLKDATTSPAMIARWWSAHPTANIAIRTGAPSRLVVVDVDGDAGWDSLHRLEDRYGELPATFSVATPSGGEHFYFAWAGFAVKSSAGTLAAGLDVRGDGGYVVIPPSEVDGRRYEIDEQRGVAAMPPWITETLAARHDAPRPPSDPNVWAPTIRDGVGEGERNTQLTRIAGYLLRIRILDVDVAAELLRAINEARLKPPLARSEVDMIIDSIASTEAAR